MERAKGDHEPQPRDITNEFETMDVMTFLNFLDTLKNEPVLSIITNWTDIGHARRLKAFIEDPSRNQKRVASIRATRRQNDEEMNVFASGVKWIEVKE